MSSWGRFVGTSLVPADDIKVKKKMLDSKAEQAIIHHDWQARDQFKITSHADELQQRRLAVAQLACSAAIAHLHCAVEESLCFEHWVFYHSSMPLYAWEWGSGAGWGNTRGNIPFASITTTTPALPARSGWGTSSWGDAPHERRGWGDTPQGNGWGHAANGDGWGDVGEGNSWANAAERNGGWGQVWEHKLNTQ
ncbi:hypothetical protein K438DRAFT_1775481 [Mycena galopus ATCC 62051]|nr:hypothetical protein K438DRAFT_1775481 [Mycena galopus ATCC 62051]